MTELLLSVHGSRKKTNCIEDDDSNWKPLVAVCFLFFYFCRSRIQKLHIFCQGKGFDENFIQIPSFDVARNIGSH